MTQGASSAYLVEVATASRNEAESLAAPARDAAGSTRFLRSVYVPEDDRWFLLYEGTSTADVVAAAERAELDVVSIAVARRTDEGEK